MESDSALSENPYDRIARWYDVDMARNMRFDDVGFYAALCEAAGGKVLEVGCGNGRILLELIRRGIDAVGIDASAGMLKELQRKARTGGVEAPTCQMDARKLAFAGTFDIVLCPYSLVTYMSLPGDLEALLGGARGVMVTGGLLVIDAFIPRETDSGSDYQLDYRRPVGANTLARYKRVTRIAPRINRVERRYEVIDANGKTVETIDTREDIRTYAPEELAGELARFGFAEQRVWWDYGRASPDSNPQFFTVAGRIA
jgi:ubiquinone/menaquinone biosynthesis C-methylase UbiE